MRASRERASGSVAPQRAAVGAFSSSARHAVRAASADATDPASSGRIQRVISGRKYEAVPVTKIA